MARANTIQTNFTSGELSPNMYGRVDVTKYFNGARKLRNMIALPQGGARRVPGTRYVGAVHTANRYTVVRRFQFSQSDSYTIEFGHQTIRIWQDRALIGAPLVVVSPYDESDVLQLKFAQSGDILYIAHPDYYPRMLTRVSHTNWTLSVYPNEDGPYLSTTPDVSVTLSNVLDRATATCLASVFSTSGGVKTITNVTAHTDNRVLITSAAHGLASNDIVLVKSVVGVPECLGAWRIQVIGANTFALYSSRKLPTTTYVSGGTAQACSGTHVEFQEDNVFKLAHIIDITSATVATVDVMDNALRPDPTIKITYDTVSLVATGNVGVFSWNDIHRPVRPTTYTGAAAQQWGIIYQYEDSLTARAHYTTCLNFNDPTKDVTVSARTITATLTASAATFASTDVGRHIRLRYGSQWVRGTITAYTSSTVVSVSLVDEVPFDTSATYKLYNNGETSTWKIGAWSSTTGYPNTVAFHQDRLVWFSNVAEPSTKWFTKTGDYYTFEPSNPDDSIVGDDNAITMRLVSRQVNRGIWMDSGPVLLSGTEGAEWQVKPSSIQQTLTPANNSASIQTAFGSADVDCLRIGSQTLFVERSALKIRELTYDFSLDSFVSKDLTILSEHITRENGGIVDWCAQSVPYSIIWVVLGNGKVAAVTYEREHEVIAWTLCDFGGVAESCCVSAVEGGEDEIYFVIRRTINAATVRYIEVITDLLSSTYYGNCGKNTSHGGAGVSYSTGHDHLIGATVGVSVDGVYIGSQVVDGSGRVHVGYLATTVNVGLLSEAVIGILDPEGGSQAGSSQGKKKRITESCARVLSSYYFKTASAQGSTDDNEILSANVEPVSGDRNRIKAAPTLGTQSSVGNIGTVVPLATFALVSGDMTYSVDNAFDDGGRFEIVQDEPYPLNVVCLMHKLNTNE